MERVESRAWGAALLGAVAALRGGGLPHPDRGCSYLIGDLAIRGSNPMVGSVPAEACPGQCREIWPSMAQTRWLVLYPQRPVPASAGRFRHPWLKADWGRFVSVR